MHVAKEIIFKTRKNRKKIIEITMRVLKLTTNILTVLGLYYNSNSNLFALLLSTASTVILTSVQVFVSLIPSIHYAYIQSDNVLDTVFALYQVVGFILCLTSHVTFAINKGLVYHIIKRLQNLIDKSVYKFHKYKD